MLGFKLDFWDYLTLASLATMALAVVRATSPQGTEISSITRGHWSPAIPHLALRLHDRIAGS